MWKRWGLAIIAAALPSLALASAGSSAAAEKRPPFEDCLLTKALALEPAGAEVSEILVAAERACQDAKGTLADTAVDEAIQKARLAVMQQRTNARNLRRRG
jgi:hypothetical protein